MYEGRIRRLAPVAFIGSALIGPALIGLTLSGLFPISHAAASETRLVKMLTGQSEVVRLRTLAMLRKDPAGSLAAIEELISAGRTVAQEAQENDLVRPSAIELLYLVGTTQTPESEGFLVELLDSSHSGIVILAIDVLGENQREGAIEHLKRQIDHPEYVRSYGFRFNLIRALARMRHPDAIEFIDSLRPTLEGQLQHEVEKLLKDVVASDFRGDAKRYESFQASRKPKIQLVSADENSESRQRLKLVPTRQYYGIDIHAKRVMFIIDRSGSMKDRVGRYTRLDQAKLELIRTIQSLPSDTEFAVGFYSDDIRLWRNELLPATAIHKKQVTQFINQLQPEGMTNTHGALRRSLEFDEQLEAVFILTDGRPTLGEVIAPDAIIKDIVHRNRFRHLNINTIGIAVDGMTEKFLRTLAELAAGEFRQPQG